MKICPNCGAENEDNIRNCLLCDFEFDVKDDELSSNQENNEVSDDSSDTLLITPVQIKQKNFPVVAILVTLLIVIGTAFGILLGILLFQKKENPKSEDNSTSSSEIIIENTKITIETNAATGEITTSETVTEITTETIKQTTLSAVTSVATSEITTSEIVTETTTEPIVTIPYITADIVEEPAMQGVYLYLVVTGSFSYYNYTTYTYNIGYSEPSVTNGNSSDNKLYLMGFSGGITKVITNVTPYDSNGVAGESVSAVHVPYSLQIASIEKYGTIYSPSDSKVDGLTREYLIDGGAASYIRHDLTHGWHIKAINQYYDGSDYWYELYDADDGDYYGWVNNANISFY